MIRQHRYRERAAERDERIVREWGWSWGITLNGISTTAMQSYEHDLVKLAAARILNRIVRKGRK